MAKYTQNDYSRLSIKQCYFMGGRWRIVLSDNKVVFVVGEEDMEDADLLQALKSQLTSEDKPEAYIITEPVTKESLKGIRLA